MTERRRPKVTFTVSPEFSEWLDAHGGGADVEPGTDGRVNASRLVEVLWRRWMSERQPDVLASIMIEERAQARTKVAEIETRAVRLLGTSLDDWETRIVQERNAAADGARASAAARVAERDDLLADLRKQVGTASRASALAWLSRATVLPRIQKVGLTPQQVVAWLRDPSTPLEPVPPRRAR